VWDVVTSQRVVSPAFEQELDSVAFSPDGATLAILSSGRDVVWSWDVTAREVTATLELPVPATNIIFKPGESTLAISHRDGTVRLWNIETAEQETLLDYETRTTNQAALSPDGGLLALASGDGVLVWNTHTREVTGSFDAFTGNVSYLQFNPAGDELWFTVSNRQGENRYIWNMQTNEAILATDAFPPLPDMTPLANAARTYSPRGAVYSVTLVPQTSILVVMDGVSLHFWDMTARVPLFRAQYLFESNTGGDILGFSADGRVMFTRNNGVVWLWGIPG
jgi:WD40 repeat protein